MTITRPDRVQAADGTTIAVHDFGGDGPLVVLCHATGFCAGVWEPLAAALRDRFRLIAPDFRAHGHSPVPPGSDLAWTGMAADLLAVVDAWSPQEAVLAVGHSMGGTAIILAEVERPGTIAAAWTFEPILLPFVPAAELGDEPALAEATRRRRAVFASRDEAVARWGAKPPLDRLDPRALDAYARHGLADRADGSVELRCRPDDEATIFHHHGTGAERLLGQVGVPFVAAVGGEPDPAPAAWVGEAAARHPEVILREYPELSHFGPLEQPDLIATDVAAFFASLADRP